MRPRASSPLWRTRRVHASDTPSRSSAGTLPAASGKWTSRSKPCATTCASWINPWPSWSRRSPLGSDADMNATPSLRFPSLAAVKAAHRHLLERFSRRDRGGEGVPRDALLNDAEQFMQDGAATGQLVAEEPDRRAIQSILDYWTTVLFRADRNPADAIVADYDPSLSPTIADADCPYLGLDAFGEDDATRFFGRSAAVTDALERLRTGRLLAVVGPSGSGKSSLVRAGVIAALKRGALNGSASWYYYPPFTPGALVSSSRSFADFVAAAGDRQVVVVVDQFEELFTYRGDEREGVRPDAGAFIDDLVV